jgi:hypothetical protein
MADQGYQAVPEAVAPPSVTREATLQKYADLDLDDSQVSFDGCC